MVGLWNRQLTTYPDSSRRYLYLAIVVLATIVLYYQLYIQYGVSTEVIKHYGMTFTYFVYVSVVANIVGAFASLLAGLADRWGRANLVVYGLLAVGLLTAFGLPNAPDKLSYLVLFSAVAFVEGMILVATPALVRDFSPQLDRASAMAYWTMGPVIGSLIVTAVVSGTYTGTTSWQDETRYAGFTGLATFLVALFGLRELAPTLRDQIMVTLRDRTLVEARAKGLHTEAVVHGQWRQMLRLDIVGPAFGIAVYLLLYYAAVGSFVIFFATVFSYPAQRTNSLLNWYWAANAIALIAAGLMSDLVKVRKPFMLIGALGSIVLTILLALRTVAPHTSYYTFALILLGVGVSVASRTRHGWRASPRPSSGTIRRPRRPGSLSTHGPCAPSSPCQQPSYRSSSTASPHWSITVPLCNKHQPKPRPPSRSSIRIQRFSRNWPSIRGGTRRPHYSSRQSKKSVCQDCGQCSRPTPHWRCSIATARACKPPRSATPAGGRSGGGSVWRVRLCSSRSSS